MSFKQWTAVIQIAAAVIVLVWLVNDATGAAGWPGTVRAAAEKTLWALLGVIVFNIVASIVMAIVVSVSRGEEFKDERADERDTRVGARSMRNAYVVASLGGLGILLFLGFGGNPAAMPYILFAVLLLAGTADALSRLIYYRVG